MYKTLVEKQTAFNECAINSEADLHSLIAELGSKPSYRFRGVNEAKYTMLSSLQRKYQKTLREQKDYMSKLLDCVKRDKDILDFFKKTIVR